MDTRDWSALSHAERVYQLEVEGYLVLPDLLDAEHIARLKAAAAKWETTTVDYSVHQRGRAHLEFVGGEIAELIAHPPTIEFLSRLFGDQIVFMSYG